MTHQVLSRLLYNEVLEKVLHEKSYHLPAFLLARDMYLGNHVAGIAPGLFLVFMESPLSYESNPQECLLRI